MSEKKEYFGHPTQMEEALIAIEGIAKIMLRIAEPRSNEASIFGFLGSQLWDNHQSAHEAFISLSGGDEETIVAPGPGV